MPYKDSFFGDPIWDKTKTFVSEDARILGRVIIEDECMICPFVQVRADEGAPFHIGCGTNLQDGVIIHGLMSKYVIGDDDREYSVWIGNNCSITHKALVHGPTKIKNETLIGFATTVHYSEVGSNCHIFHSSLIESSKIGDRVHVGSNSSIIRSKIGNHTFVSVGAKIVDVSIPDRKEVSVGASIYRIDKNLCMISAGTFISKKFKSGKNHIVNLSGNSGGPLLYGIVIPCKQLKDALPDISELSENKFNSEVVEFNTKLSEIMRKREKSIKMWEANEKLKNL